MHILDWLLRIMILHIFLLLMLHLLFLYLLYIVLSLLILELLIVVYEVDTSLFLVVNVFILVVTVAVFKSFSLGE